MSPLSPLSSAHRDPSRPPLVAVRDTVPQGRPVTWHVSPYGPSGNSSEASGTGYLAPPTRTEVLVPYRRRAEGPRSPSRRPLQSREPPQAACRLIGRRAVDRCCIGGLLTTDHAARTGRADHPGLNHDQDERLFERRSDARDPTLLVRVANFSVDLPRRGRDPVSARSGPRQERRSAGPGAAGQRRTRAPHCLQPGSARDTLAQEYAAHRQSGSSPEQGYVPIVARMISGRRLFDRISRARRRGGVAWRSCSTRCV